MTEHTCSTCRWWVCYLRPVHDCISYYGNCKYAEMHDRQVRQGALAFAQPIKCYDTNAESATLQTSPDFGCNQWEEKE